MRRFNNVIPARGKIMQENFFIFFVHKIAARWDYVCEGAEWFGLTPNQGNTHEMKTGTMKAALLAALSGLTFAASAAQIAAEIRKPGQVLFLR